MGLFGKLFKGPEIDMERSSANTKKIRALFPMEQPWHTLPTDTEGKSEEPPDERHK